MNPQTIPPLEDGDPIPLDLHALSRSRAGSSQKALRLDSNAAQTLMRSLEGLHRVHAVLIAATEPDRLLLGEWINSGLLASAEQLTFRMSGVLEQADRDARRQGGAA